MPQSSRQSLSTQLDSMRGSLMCLSLEYKMNNVIVFYNVAAVGGLFRFLLWCPAYSSATERLRHLLTTATRSGRFIRLRRRSHRSPGKISNANTSPDRKAGAFLMLSYVLGFLCHCEMPQSSRQSLWTRLQRLGLLHILMLDFRSILDQSRIL